MAGDRFMMERSRPFVSDGYWAAKQRFNSGGRGLHPGRKDAAREVSSPGSSSSATTRPRDGQYSMTTRPSILPCFISSKTALISLRCRVDTVGWIWPRA